MPDRTADSVTSAVGAVLLGLAAGAHATALWRTHGLLAGASPILGILLALASLVLVMGAVRSRALPGWRGSLLALTAILLGAVAAPLLMARTPQPASLLVATLAVLLPGLVPAARPRPLAAGLLGAGLGALAGALLLPFTGPFLLSLGAAPLAAAGLGLLASASHAASRSAPEPEGRWHLLPAALAGIPVALVGLALVGDGAHPWPATPARAGCLVLGLAVGVALARRVPGRAAAAVAVAGLALAALLASPPALRLVDHAAERLAVSPERPAVGVAGGLLTLLLGAALAALPAGVAAGLTVPRGSRREGALLAGGLVAVATATAWWALRAGELEARAAEPPSRALLALADGHAVAWTGAQRAPDDLLAGHLPAMAASGRIRAVVLGWGSPRTLQALRLHGFESVEEFGPSRAMAPGFAEAGWEAPSGEIHGLAGLRAMGRADVVISNLEDPSLPAHEPFFTQAAHEAIRRQLLPGGVFVQRLSAERLGPEGLLRHALLLQETFPDTWLATADLARGGSVLALCLGPAAGPSLLAPPRRAPPPAPTAAAPPAVLSQAGTDAARADDVGGGAPRVDVPIEATPASPPLPSQTLRPLPLRALVSAEGLPPDIRQSLREARLLNVEDVLATLVAGPVEIAAVAGSLTAHDPWIPGTAAFRHPAPPDVARDLAQGLLYGRIGRVDVPLEVRPAVAPGAHGQRWDFVSIESSLEASYQPREALVRYVNHLGRSFGRPAISRVAARKLSWEAPGRRLDLWLRRQAEADLTALAVALSQFEGEHLLISGGALVHGHPGAWMLEQEGVTRQEVTLAWHCPVRASLHVAEMVLTEGVRPGLYQEPLAVLTHDLRCHPARPDGGGAEGDDPMRPQGGDAAGAASGAGADAAAGAP